MNFRPVGVNERIATLDILRGFSLLGILLVNMFGFYLPMPHIADLSSWFTEAKDIILQQYLDIYVQSSFYPLFSMLFGYGLAMQFLKAKANGTNFYKFAPKRLVILFVIGMLHAFLIWWGDILATYAFCGVFLMAFLRLRSGGLLTVAIVLNGLYHFFFISVYMLGGFFNEPTSTLSVDITAIQNAVTAYGVGNWMDAFTQRLDDLAIQLSTIMWISSLFTILPYMLVGAAMAKWRLIERAKEKLVLWIVLAVVGLGVGIYVKSLPIAGAQTFGNDYLQVYVGGPILAIGYIAVIVLLTQLPVIVKILSPIAKAGRMSMTLYLMQSIVCTALFYNWGFGLYGKVDVQMGIYIALGLFIVQVLFAELWLSKFKQGPLEAAIKRLTYGKN
ncbi:hypothetical protein DCE79_03095 [Lysinibacillus sp. 2017]|uniref:DUF418 domain-containing protein n=1 Tax=unclassified Lysinibacillus TaxID=2636778 RepID=UPI000D527BDC|nr:MULTISPECIES: DUF418 domain-containing protein [unclassified Lysinibacillus]AWE06430.1 hypothetical protein DCE79_03095 [Lysinibacillus sp. 2017]TGN32025.1 DUF418 domain-containing protein [Lysinibacillus sp. S2017]